MLAETCSSRSSQVKVLYLLRCYAHTHTHNHTQSICSSHLFFPRPIVSTTKCPFYYTYHHMSSIFIWLEGYNTYVGHFLVYTFLPFSAFRFQTLPSPSMFHTCFTHVSSMFPRGLERSPEVLTHASTFPFTPQPRIGQWLARAGPWPGLLLASTWTPVTHWDGKTCLTFVEIGRNMVL